LKKQPEFQILDTFQQLTNEIETGDRFTIKNLLQIKLQTSFQETFFKEKILQETCIEIVQDIEELLAYKNLDFFGDTNKEIMMLIGNSQMKMLKNIQEKFIVQEYKSYKKSIEVQLYNQGLIINQFMMFTEEIKKTRKNKWKS
jgi:hypothetical protein